MIVRAARPASKWTSVANSVVDDGALSFRALGILVYVLSKPDGWSVRSAQLAATHSEGRDAVRSALNELEEAGYMVRSKTQDERGQWSQNSIVYDHPVAADEPTEDGFPGFGLPGAGKSGPVVTTEEQLLTGRSTTPAHSVGSRAAAPKPRRLVLPDGDGTSTSTDEEPAGFGGDRKPRTSPERKEIARQRGRSGLGLAMRLQRGLLEAGVKGTTNVAVVTTRLNEQRQSGYTWPELNAMVDTFVAAPARYTLGSTEPWKAFLNSIQKLADDNAKVTAVAPSAYATDPYAGMEED